MGSEHRLRVLHFPPGTTFGGEILGSLERTEAGRMLDALVVLRERDTGDVRAVDLATARAGGTIARMLDFRLDPAQRILATRRTLAAHADGVPPAVIDAVAHAIEPGATVMALLLDDAGAPSFDEALARTGGAVVVDVPVSARGLAELAPQLVSALP